MPLQKVFSKKGINKSILRTLLTLAGVAALIVLAFAAGYLANQPVRTETKTPAQADGDRIRADMDDDESTPGTVRVSPEKQQLMGIKVDVVKKAAYKHLLKVPGRVVADETRIYQINSAVEGWITKVYDNTTTGGLVKKDQLLALYASPNFLSAQQAYLNAIVSQERYGLTYREKVQQLSRPVRTTKQYRDTLSSLGMTDTQIEQITESRDWDEYIQVRAPGAGFILKRNVTQGLRFDKGTPFYTIADLSRIWIVADLYENDAFKFQPGQIVDITIPGQSRKFTARVSNILPQFDPASRTLKVRLEANNPGYILRPDMFVDVELSITVAPAIFVPAEAVLDTGLKKTVFVARTAGSFEPRPVTTGRRLGNVVEIESGLREGERIVLSGNFLLDAESKLELSAAGVNAALETDPVCGMGIIPKKAHNAGRVSLYQGKTYVFCSDPCKQNFDRSPEHYLQKAGKHDGDRVIEQTEKGAQPRTGKHTKVRSGHSAARVRPAQEIDPVCGMGVEPKEAQTAGRKSLYKGKAYFFCSDSCKQRFDSSPESYLQKTGKNNGVHSEKHEEVHSGKHNEKDAVAPAIKHPLEHVEQHTAAEHPQEPAMKQAMEPTEEDSGKQP